MKPSISSSTVSTETKENTGGSTTTTTNTTIETASGDKVTVKSEEVVKETENAVTTTTKNSATSETVTEKKVEETVIDENYTESTTSTTETRSFNGSTGKVKVEIPVEDVTSGTVAVVVNSDGTETILKASTVIENGVGLALDGDAPVKVVDNSKHFVDVHPVDHWAEETVGFVVARTIYNGTSANTFHPDKSMTRGMPAVVLHNLEDNPDHAFDGVFHDVEEDSWFEDAIHWAAVRAS